jgi:hypothetical protein
LVSLTDEEGGYDNYAGYVAKVTATSGSDSFSCSVCNLKLENVEETVLEGVRIRDLELLLERTATYDTNEDEGASSIVVGSRVILHNEHNLVEQQGWNNANNVYFGAVGVVLSKAWGYGGLMIADVTIEGTAVVVAIPVQNLELIPVIGIGCKLDCTDPNCDTCLLTDKCEVCKAGYHIEGDGCKLTCDDEHCDTCDPKDNCKTCDEGYYPSLSNYTHLIDSTYGDFRIGSGSSHHP